MQHDNSKGWNPLAYWVPVNIDDIWYLHLVIAFTCNGLMLSIWKIAVKCGLRAIRKVCNADAWLITHHLILIALCSKLWIIKIEIFAVNAVFMIGISMKTKPHIFRLVDLRWKWLSNMYPTIWPVQILNIWHMHRIQFDTYSKYKRICQHRCGILAIVYIWWGSQKTLPNTSLMNTSGSKLRAFYHISIRFSCNVVSGRRLMDMYDLHLHVIRGLPGYRFQEKEAHALGSLAVFQMAFSLNYSSIVSLSCPSKTYSAISYLPIFRAIWWTVRM